MEGSITTKCCCHMIKVNNLDMPSRVLDRLSEVLDRPSKALDIPTEALDRTSEALDRPSEALDTPSEAEVNTRFKPEIYLEALKRP